MNRDIYDPPPAPIHLAPPRAEPLTWTTPDVAILVCRGVALTILAAWSWSVEPTLGILTLAGGMLVLIESWFSALSFLNRRPLVSFSERWRIFLAALVPWVLGLSVAAGLMLALFSLSDWAG